METIAIIAIVVGLVEMSKRAIGFRSGFAPIYAIIYATIAHYIILEDASLREDILYGVLVGFAACGLYSAFKPK